MMLEWHCWWQGQHLVMSEYDFLWQAQIFWILRGTFVAARKVPDVSCVAIIRHECLSSMMFSIPQVAQRNVLEVSCVATINHELRSSIALCIP